MNGRNLIDYSPTNKRTEPDVGILCEPRRFCLLCGREGQQLYTELSDWLCGVPGNWGMRTCKDCVVAWLDPQPAVKDFPKLYSRYHTHHAASATKFDRLRRATLQCVLARMGYPVEESKQILPRLLSRFRSVACAAALDVMDLAPSQAGTLLDVGCGNGEFIGRMRSLGWRVSGVDPDPAAVAKGREEGLQIFGGTVEDVPRTNLYDAITLNHVIEHVSDPVALLRHCRSRLRPRTGMLIMTTPNLNSFGHGWFKNYWRGLEVPRHLVLFSPSALSECVARSGLCLQTLRTETRLARMIFAPSVCAQRGVRNIGEKVNYDVATKCASYVFQLLEDLMASFKKDIGEEIYCSCTAPAEGNDEPQ
jgi:2-polyprenyl-3-methyl-5-hydroxy-6-metoxy-1,4-benzoquinol methylase